MDILVLGSFDLESPLAVDVISEQTEIKCFTKDAHLDQTIAVASLSGCDVDELCRSGLNENLVPIISLSRLVHNTKQLQSAVGMNWTTAYAVSAREVEAEYKNSVAKIEGQYNESVYLADCVFGLCDLILRSNSEINESVFKQLTD